MAAKRVLIVEDDPDARSLFRNALSAAGFDVEDVGDGLAALRRLDEYPPDLIVLDLGLPIVNGYEVREEIRAQAATRDLPIVVVTGSAIHDPDVFDQACVVLLKPILPERIVAVVTECLHAYDHRAAVDPSSLDAR
jgi:CheY-like chemotaxis protein